MVVVVVEGARNKVDGTRDDPQQSDAEKKSPLLLLLLLSPLKLVLHEVTTCLSGTAGARVRRCAE